MKTRGPLNSLTLWNYHSKLFYHPNNCLELKTGWSKMMFNEYCVLIWCPFNEGCLIAAVCSLDVIAVILFY